MNLTKCLDLLMIVSYDMKMSKEKNVPPLHIKCEITKYNEVKVCEKCQGIGSYEIEELIDYHKRNHRIYRKSCTICAGDGRVVEMRTVVDVKYESSHYPKTYIPYTDAIANGIKLHQSDTSVFTYRLDRTDRKLNKEYPELAAVSYEVYDDLVEKYNVINTLKK